MAAQPADTIRRMPARALDPVAAIVVADLKASLARLYGQRLRGVFVFGSRARGDAGAESDVDILVILDDFDVYGTQLETTSEARAAVALRHDIAVSTVFVRERDWLAESTPFLDNVRLEAIAA